MLLSANPSLDAEFTTLLYRALAKAEAAVVTPTLHERLVLATAFALTVQIGVEAQTERVQEAVFGVRLRRQSAYALHEDWARRSVSEREETFSSLRADLVRIDPKFADLPSDQGTTQKSFACTVVNLAAISSPAVGPTLDDRIATELKRAVDAKHHPRRLTASHLREIFRVADVIAETLAEAENFIRGKHGPTAPVYMSVLLHSAGREHLDAVRRAMYPAYSERDDLLQGFVLLADAYRRQATPEGKFEIAVLLNHLLLHRSENFAQFSHEDIHGALDACPPPKKGGHARKGSAQVLAALIALTPKGTLGFKEMDAAKIAANLQKQASAERRRRRSPA